VKQKSHYSFSLNLSSNTEKKRKLVCYLDIDPCSSWDFQIIKEKYCITDMQEVYFLHEIDIFITFLFDSV